MVAAKAITVLSLLVTLGPQTGDKPLHLPPDVTCQSLVGFEAMIPLSQCSPVSSHPWKWMHPQLGRVAGDSPVCHCVPRQPGCQTHTRACSSAGHHERWETQLIIVPPTPAPCPEHQSWERLPKSLGFVPKRGRDSLQCTLSLPLLSYNEFGHRLQKGKGTQLGNCLCREGLTGSASSNVGSFPSREWKELIPPQADFRAQNHSACGWLSVQIL